MSSRRIWSSFLLVLCIALLASIPAFGQYRGRKYKAPPPTSHIEVRVSKKYNGKPIPNAGVVFNPSKDGKDLGSLEIKTDPDGKAVIDVIPTGSTVRVQVIAEGFSTYGQDYVIDQPSKEISISMLRPQAQISAYEDNSGKAAERKPGVQEPIRPKPATPAETPAQSSPVPQL
ncbi:MAG TPA: hypothetical protein VGU67_00320 [Edaphobacter sp.]|nr:hypothetical protein [Edaphobacter sp.]